MQLASGTIPVLGVLGRFKLGAPRPYLQNKTYKHTSGFSLSEHITIKKTS